MSVIFPSEMNQLPIHPFESEIVDAIRNHPFLVIVGETGSGLDLAISAVS